jgi:hypothetical protein
MNRPTNPDAVRAAYLKVCRAAVMRTRAELDVALATMTASPSDDEYTAYCEAYSAHSKAWHDWRIAEANL